jgi:hypothetical protein
MKIKYLASIAICAVTLASATEQKTLSLNQFEWHQPISFNGKDAIIRFELPLSAYDGATRSDMGDLRIFNAAGEIVPHALIQNAPPEKTVTTLAVKHFPVYYNAKNRNDNVAINVTKREDGSLISTQISAGKEKTEQKLGGYILDASTIKQPIIALLADWPSQPNGTVFQVDLQTSDDLQLWHDIASRVQLVDLNHAGHQLRRNRIELRGKPLKYFRVRYSYSREAVAITGFTVETTAQATMSKALKWTSMALRATDKAGEYLFDSPGVPVAGLRIKFAQGNTLAPAKIYRRAKDKDEWQEASSVVVYRLSRNGEEINSPDVVLDASQHRQWRVVFDQGSGGIGQGLPMVDIGWMPQNVIFIARGEAPFLMAYGSRDALPNGYTAATLVPGYEQEKLTSFQEAKQDKVHHVNPGMSKPAEPVANWRIICLWGILVIGVLGLAYMAWKLLGQMNKNTENTKSE